MVISGGENVYPAEVEDVLCGHAGVREVGVIGQPSARWGESVCAVVVRGDGWKGDDDLLVQELRALAHTRLARFKQPKAYVFIPALPRNPSGKILKRMLREQFPGPAPE
jgi:acyl-CoA synthetase (AMP-forming)/AMP-acid ligase II